eukprot:GHRQ01022508.1.p2 GENE.GHRQ01022508.1~~GHRQ01022508.1.p2  ORF type:complete len:125 (+),score=30.12 GHRQ01022508.1:180-554(+)
MVGLMPTDMWRRGLHWMYAEVWCAALLMRACAVHVCRALPGTTVLLPLRLPVLILLACRDRAAVLTARLCCCCAAGYADISTLELGLLFPCRLGLVDLKRPEGERAAPRLPAWYWSHCTAHCFV